MRQGLHCYAMVRFELDDPKILLVTLADLMICGSYACRTLRESPYLANVVTPTSERSQNLTETRRPPLQDGRCGWCSQTQSTSTSS